MAGGLMTESVLDEDFDRDPESDGEGYFASVEDRMRYAEDERFEEPKLGVHEAVITNTIYFLLKVHALSAKTGRAVSELLFLLSAEPRVRRRPDVAFVSNDRWPLNKAFPVATAWPVVPDLAVEVISPTDRAFEVVDKVAEAFRLGVRLVWVVYPRQMQVYVYRSAVDVEILGRDGTLDGGDVLPGFSTPVAGIFESLEGDAPADEAGASPS